MQRPHSHAREEFTGHMRDRDHGRHSGRGLFDAQHSLDERSDCRYLDGSLSRDGQPRGVRVDQERLGSASCPDWTAQTSPEEVLSKAKVALPSFPDSVLRFQPQLIRYFADCGIWNVGESPDSTRSAVISNAPVLMLGGTFDAVTAISWQDALKPGLTNSQSVSFPGLGHTVVDQSPCAMSVMQAFLAAPQKPVDQACVAQMTIPTFTTS